MFFTPLNYYTQQFRDHLEQYEKNFQEKNNLTADYIEERKSHFKDIENRLNDEFEKIQYMNSADVYLNLVNLTLPQIYLNVYFLWLEKMRELYKLDSQFLVDLIKLSTPILQENPFLHKFNIFDIYKHFDFLNIKTK